MEKGFTQVYTGNGKGKTTAAYGLALRAVGAGLKVYIAQFMKDYPYSEKESFKKFKDDLFVEQIGNDDFVLRKENPNEVELKIFKEGLKKVKMEMMSQNWDIVILDEICVSMYFKIFSVEEVLDFINNKPYNVELVLTGRYCPDEIIEVADLVSEVTEIKHYYQNGILARKGIDS